MLFDDISSNHPRACVPSSSEHFLYFESLETRLMLVSLCLPILLSMLVQKSNFEVSVKNGLAVGTAGSRTRDLSHPKRESYH